MTLECKIVCVKSSVRREREREIGVFITIVDLTAVKERNIEDLSGGELQRFACAIVCIQRADM